MNSISQTLWPQIEPLLLQVRSPSQYLGGELNTITKDHNSVAVKIALCFSDTYHIGMSHWGMQVLYGIINNHKSALAERAFTPQIDMENLLRKNNIPLFTLETHTPLNQFDIVAFSLQYELSYTNVLNMLSLAGIPLLSKERSDNTPLVIAGGPCVFNPEPLADFIDIFVIGDGEERIVDIIEAIKQVKSTNTLSRKELVRHLARSIPSLYAPSLYGLDYNDNGTIREIRPLFDDLPLKITKATVENLDEAYYPTSPIVPYGEVIHSRINLEIMRGCPHLCKFCISGVIKSPLRFRSVSKLTFLAEEIYKKTGYDEISLLSLSSSDYPDIDELILRLTSRFKSKRVGLSLPSLRVDENLFKLPEVLNAVRKSGLTMAPEAGTERLREIISKNIQNEDLYQAVRAAYKNGWRLVKLYFMIGLPTETADDLKAIADIVHQASGIGREFFSSRGNINVTISPFVPKPHTLFQWAGMDNIETLRQKQEFLGKLLRGGARSIRAKFHLPERSYLESVFSRGDRRLGRLLLLAHQQGCRLDAWDEFFDFTRWLKAFKEMDDNFDPDFYALRKRELSEILPWDIIEAGLPVTP
ncbi:MAG: TIGR03960 family B12-binding radical SAM protein [Planctomycetota bacterium]|nr:TIGR03960 family B12-binding radical SAM protein [Planctomycetota bacterium]MDI6788185.1 TIGR03960 family B12-binding radical SAM protein [Planctomycetota bacterium]